MAFEDDILQAVEERIHKEKTVDSFVGTLQSEVPLLVIMDGTSVGLPCKKAQHVTLTGMTRVVVQRFGTEYVVMGALA